MFYKKNNYMKKQKLLLTVIICCLIISGCNNDTPKQNISNTSLKNIETYDETENTTNNKISTENNDTKAPTEKKETARNNTDAQINDTKKTSDSKRLEIKEEEIPVMKIIEYENKMHNFSIEIPNTWAFQENINWFNIEIKTPKNDKINENLGIVVQELQTNETLTSYTEKTIKWLKDLYEDYNEIKKEDVEINQIKCTALTYEISGNWYEIKAQQTVFLKDNKPYIFQYTATKNTFNNYIDDINKIINSFTILI